jgi:hypothetical protein
MRFDQLKRRDFITLIDGGGGVAARGTRAAVWTALTPHRDTCG